MKISVCYIHYLLQCAKLPNLKVIWMSILILIVVRARVTRARVRVSRQSLAEPRPAACRGPRGEAAALRARGEAARAANPRHVAAKPRAAKLGSLEMCMAYCYLQCMMAAQVKNSTFQMNHFYCLPNTTTP